MWCSRKYIFVYIFDICLINRVLTYQCQLDDFENYELSLLLVFVEREQIHSRTERLQKHDCTSCPWPTIHSLVCHSLNTVWDTQHINGEQTTSERSFVRCAKTNWSLSPICLGVILLFISYMTALTGVKDADLCCVYLCLLYEELCKPENKVKIPGEFNSKLIKWPPVTLGVVKAKNIE